MYKEADMKQTIYLILLVFSLSLYARFAYAVSLEPSGESATALPITSMSLDVNIINGIAETTAIFVFQTKGVERTEGFFKYELPDGAFMTGFSYWFKEKEIAGIIQENEFARRTYQGIVSGRRDPALGEVSKENIFSARIFPLDTADELKIKVHFQQFLQQNSSLFSYVYPMTKEQPKTINRFLISVSIKDNRSVQKLETNYGAIHKDKETSVIYFKKENFKPEEDFKLSYNVSRSLNFLSSQGNTEGYFIIHDKDIQDVEFGKADVYDLITVSKNPLFVVGRYHGQGKVILKLADGKMINIELSRRKEDYHEMLHKLWAFHSLRDLLMREKEFTGQVFLREIIINFSMEQGIPSPYTSFLAIPDEEKPTWHKEQKFVKQYWGGKKEEDWLTCRPKKPQIQNSNYKPPSYVDVPRWASDAVNTLRDEGVIEGFGGYLKPYQPVTRYELAIISARLIEKSCNIKGDPDKETLFFVQRDPYVSSASVGQKLGDVPETNWAYEAIMKVTHLGIMYGNEKGLFRGKNPISRYELAATIWRLLHLFNVPLNSLENKFYGHIHPSDMPYSHWARYYVSDLVKKGIFVLDEKGNFYGDWLATRVEIAVVMHRYLKALEGSPLTYDEEAQKFSGTFSTLEAPPNVNKVSLTHSKKTQNLLKGESKWFAEKYFLRKNETLEFQCITDEKNTIHVSVTFDESSGKKHVRLKTNAMPAFMVGGFTDSIQKAFSFHKQEGIFSADFEPLYKITDTTFTLILVLNQKETFVFFIPVNGG